MTDDEAEKILSQIEPPDVIEGEHRRTLKERLLEAHSDKVESPNMLGTGILMATHSRIWLLRYAEAAAAACIVIGLAVWLCSHREEAQKPPPGTTAPRLAVVAPPPAPSVDDLPPTEAGLLRAYLQSPQTFDPLLKRKERTTIRTTQIPTALDVWRLLETMDNDKEKCNETRSTGCRDGAVA